jgi:hypothetical protein
MRHLRIVSLKIFQFFNSVQKKQLQFRTNRLGDSFHIVSLGCGNIMCQLHGTNIQNVQFLNRHTVMPNEAEG